MVVVQCMELVVEVLVVFQIPEQQVHSGQAELVELVSHIPPEVEVPVDKRQELTGALERLEALATCVEQAEAVEEATLGQELEAVVEMGVILVAVVEVVEVVQLAQAVEVEQAALEK